MNLSAILDEIVADIGRATERGRVATYIPELACIDPGQFGIAVTPLGGETIGAGDWQVPFSVQSVSKVFTLTLALERVGEALWSRVGCEPSGDPFNSIVQLEAEKGVPRNPFINAGAIVLADAVLAARAPPLAISEIRDFVRRLADDPGIEIDANVASSERQTGFRNAALAHFMAAEGNLHSPVANALEVYFNHCALAMSCQQLSRAGRYLVNGGLAEGDRITTAERARRITALMLTCGHYDGSGAFAFCVGIPGKSGVGGGILAIVPGVASIAAWSPGLGPKGNSLLATKALEILADRTGWSVFGRLTP